MTDHEDDAHITANIDALRAAVRHHLGDPTVSNDMLHALTPWLESVTTLHEQRTDGLGCQWCNDEDWPCADMRHAQAVARTMTTNTEAPDE